MADFDFSSLVSTVLPTAIGGIMGARPGGIGAIPGALYGLSSGVRYGMESDLQRELANRQIALQNAQLQHKERELDLQARNYDRLEMLANEQLKKLDLERQRQLLSLEEAQRTVEGQKKFREQLPAEWQAAFDATPDKQGFINRYYDDKRWEAKVENSRKMLERMDVDPEFAKALGPVTTGHLLQTIVAAKSKPEERWAVIYSPNTDTIIKWDKVTGKWEYDKIGQGKRPPNERGRVERDLFGIWKQQQPAMAKVMEADEEAGLTLFQKWRNTPAGRLEEAFLYGEIDPATHRAARESLIRQENELKQIAIDEMRKAYLAADPNLKWYNRDVPQTEEGFQKYLETPEGKKNLMLWRERIRDYGRPAPRNEPTYRERQIEQQLENAKRFTPGDIGRIQSLERALAEERAKTGRAQAAPGNQPPSAQTQAPAMAQAVPKDPEERKKFIQNYLFQGQ